MTDFVVFAFVSIVATVLLAATLGVLIDSVINPDGDRSAIIGSLADITTTLIGALVGFVAGKGAGHSEAREEQHAEEMARQERRRPDDTP